MKSIHQRTPTATGWASPEQPPTDSNAPGQSDWFLQSLISLVNNRPHVHIDVALMVGGLVVTGTLVSGRTYFLEFARQFAEGFGFNDHSARQAAYASVAEHAERFGNRNEDDSEDPPAYIHLLDPRFAGQGAEEYADGARLWRGRVGSVDGFHLATGMADSTAQQDQGVQ